MPKVLVTGAAGFIASHLTRALVEAGWAVRALDDLSGAKDWGRIADLGSGVEKITASIIDAPALAAAMEGVDAVVHHAARVSVPESVADPMGYQQTDATGTLAVLEAARAAGVGRFVYASTCAAYGDDPKQPKCETDRADPVSPYAVAKYCGEMYVTAYGRLHAMTTVALRYFNVFGPGQDPKSQYGAAIPSIVTRMLAGERPTIYGDGHQTRDFCFVGNVVRANLLALAVGQSKAGLVVNIGCGRRVSVNDIVEQTNVLLGTRIKPLYEPPRAGDVRDSLADISLAGRELGYEPAVHFSQGLQYSVEAYRKAAEQRG